MSQIHEKSPKHCATKQRYHFPNLHKKLYFYLSTTLLTILALIILVWLTLHPKKPQFSVKSVEINQLSLSTSSLLNSSIQLTILSTNPNKKIGIYYDEILLYASYKGQKITTEISLSSDHQAFYQEHEETTLLSASLVGNSQPVSPSFGYEIQLDKGSGRLALSLKMMGSLRWKIGSWVSGKYRFTVNCVSVVAFGEIPSPPLSSKQGAMCSTSL